MQLDYSLSVNNVSKYFGTFKALSNISFNAKKGEFVTLLGPSGCGKTTLLRIIAGFIEPEEGTIMFGNKIVNDVPPYKRNTAMCFQSYALFPHKSVYENIRFGLRMRKIPENLHREKVDEAMKMVNLTGLEQRKPYELSGGQQQRVALARSIVVRPDILLFDEPLSNLDAKLREKVRIEIRDIQKSVGITTIYVTHDQSEALAISDKILSMNNGAILQEADPRTIYESPNSKFVADFIGVANILSGKLISKKEDQCIFNTEIGEISTNKHYQSIPDKVSLCIRPEDFYPLLEGERPANTNIITGKVENSVYMGNMLDLFIKVNKLLLRANVSNDYKIEQGAIIDIAIPYNKIHIVNEA